MSTHTGLGELMKVLYNAIIDDSLEIVTTGMVQMTVHKYIRSSELK